MKVKINVLLNGKYVEIQTKETSFRISKNNLLNFINLNYEDVFRCTIQNNPNFEFYQILDNSKLKAFFDEKQEMLIFVNANDVIFIDNLEYGKILNDEEIEIFINEARF